MTEHQTWSIIVFAFNEEGNITSTLEKAYAAIKKISPDDFELIVVDDGSTDNTNHLINEFANSKPNVIVLQHKKNKGIGKALITGYSHASKENVCAIPADGQFNTEELIPFAVIEPHTIVSFYRLKKTYYSPFRKILTFFNRHLNFYILGIKIKDVNWIKVYKNEALKKMDMAMSSSLVESEICAKMLINHKKLIEVQSVYNKRLTGESKGASFKIVLKAVKDIFGLYREIKKYKQQNIKNKA